MLKIKFSRLLIDINILIHIKNDLCLQLWSQINPTMLDIIYLYNGY